MKIGWLFLTIAGVGFNTAVLAHDGGHGPKINDTGKHGGVVAAVVAATEKTHGSKAKLIYKAELIRMQDGSIKYYLYDEKMNPLVLTKFDKKGQGTVEFTKKKQVSALPFDLELKDDAYVGKAPVPGNKPFNIDIQISESGKKLFAAFDNLD